MAGQDIPKPARFHKELNRKRADGNPWNRGKKATLILEKKDAFWKPLKQEDTTTFRK